MQIGKLLRSYLPVFLLACLLLSLLLYTRSAADVRSPVLHAELSGEAGSREIPLWKSPDGSCFLFLPSGCTLSETVIRLDTTAAVTVDGTQIRDGQSLAGFETGKPYILRAGPTSCSFQILQSANVATLYLDTASGSMKAIHADKNNSETVTVTLFTAQGKLDYSGSSCTIRGRGNSTWVYEKRPYLLTFTQTADLLGMGAASKWVLLANASDESNLRNKLIYDLAAQTGMYWTPQCEYVDVYLNGEYAGLYLLAERVEMGENRLNLSHDPDSFLCKLDLYNRLPTLENPIVTASGRAVEITDPENIPTAHTDAIAAKVQLLEDAILGGQIGEHLDLDSWATRLLIDEISENLDGDRASSYFYCTGGKFYAGPVWDYDHIWGTRDTNLNPEALLAASPLKAPDKPTPYNNALYENPVFYARMVQIYEETVLPLFQELADGGIEALGKEISAAGTMNSIRWRHMYDYWDRPKMDAADLSAFLTRRLSFLNSIWLENGKYYAIQVDIGADYNYLNFVVRPGEPFTRLSEIEVPGVSDPVWVDSATGEVYREDQPVTRDTRLNLVQSTSSENPWKDLTMILCYAAALLAGTVWAVWLDRRSRRPKRRRRT